MAEPVRARRLTDQAIAHSPARWPAWIPRAQMAGECTHAIKKAGSSAGRRSVKVLISRRSGYPWPWSYTRQPAGVLTKHRLHGCQPVGMLPSELPCVYISKSTHSSLRPASDAGTW